MKTLPLARPGRLSDLAIACLVLLVTVPSPALGTEEARELQGLWSARLRFGPDIRGTLRVEHQKDGWRAEVAGVSADASLDHDAISFELPGGRGGFRGHFASNGERIIGHWIQEPTVTSGGRCASPVTLERTGKLERWQGTIDPLGDEFTVYMKVSVAPDGSLRMFIKNPERNFGWFARNATLERDGKAVRLREKGEGKEPGRIVSEGRFEEDVLSLPLRAGTYDFRRVAPDAASDFYPRSRPGAGASYRYRVPPALDDGWPVATPEEVGVSREKLETLVREIIDTPIDSLSTPEVHGVLIARHGKLVLEEYFHGEHRDKPHDTRSASKSVVAVLAGAAIQSGVGLGADSRVYQVMNGGAMPAGLEPGKRALTLEHLLTMSSGLDCDDNDENSPGAEDRVAEQEEEPDFWKLTLALNMIRDPGEKAVYASMQANLAGGVVRSAAGRPLTDLFHDLLAEPLQIRRYWLGLMPSGEVYNGGGARFLPRDFMKFGQLMVNRGRWGKHRVVSEAWAARSTSPLVQIGSKHAGYGYLWWLIDYPYQGRTVRGFYAGGNGGQVVMGIPELDLVIAFFGGNYSDRIMFDTQSRLIPEFVLPAVAGK